MNAIIGFTALAAAHVNQPDFQEGNITTDFIPQHYPDL